MFTQHVYNRRPVLTTYRRKTRIEHFIDSSDDDSDLDEQQQQPSPIPKKQQHASALSIVQPQLRAPLPTSLPILSTPPPCQPEKQQTGLPLTNLPVTPSYISTNPIARVPDQQQPDYTNNMDMFDLLPLNDELSVPSIPPNAVLERMLVQEQTAASSYEQTSYQSTPQDPFGFSETQTPTMNDDIRSLSLPSQTASYDGVFGLASLSALSPPNPLRPSSTDTHEQQQQKQQAFDTFDLLEFSCQRRTRGTSPAIEHNNTDFAAAAAAPPPQKQQLIEPDIFDFPELPPSRRSRLVHESSATSKPPTQQPLEFAQMWLQWTGTAAQTKETHKEPITKQLDVFDFSSPPPQSTTLKAGPLEQSRKSKAVVTPKKDIFDFPDEDPNDAVIVATPLPLLQQHSNNNKKNKMKKKPMAVLASNRTESSSKNPDKVQQHQKRKQPRQPKQVRFAPEIQVSTFREQSFERDEAQTVPIQDKPVKGAVVADENRPPRLFPLIHNSLKRKRNLISGLKSAAGVAATQSQLRRYDFDDDQEEDPSASATQVRLPEEEDDDDEEHGKAGSSWLDLVGSEPDDEGSPVAHRPQYQPQNPMNVRVTYGRHRGSASQDPEMIELDNLLAQLRDCK